MVADPPVALTIAAHDPLGGAGLAADLTTFAALGVHGAVAITAVTAQRFGSVDRVDPVPIDLLAEQLDGIIESLPIATLKVGLLGSAAVVKLVSERIVAGDLPRPVVDPVLVDGRGRRFVGGEIESAMRDHLFPVAAVVTPNLGEASLLAGRTVTTPDEVEAAAGGLAALGAGLVVVTGGAAPGAIAVDVAVDPAGAVSRLEGPWVQTPHVRGSGCTFAAALTAGLARGESASEAAQSAKRFVESRLRMSNWPSLGAAGPVAHWIEGGR